MPSKHEFKGGNVIFYFFFLLLLSCFLLVLTIASKYLVLIQTYQAYPGTRRHVLQTATRYSKTRIANSHQVLEDTYCKQLPGTRRHVLQTDTRHSKTRIANSNLTFVSTRSYRHIHFTDFHLSFCYNQN